MSGHAKLTLEISGAVQGVGFRPFVYRLARESGLVGWVINDGRGVFIEVEGERPSLELFRSRIETEPPPLALVTRITSKWGTPEGFAEFSIRASDDRGAPTAVVLPDSASCRECLAEVLDERDRRYRYPFTNCTNCGPRFSIIRRLPYDRPNTTMRRFIMCESCRQEYENPLDRRFHAQPNACPSCGPHVTLTDSEGTPLASGDAALEAVRSALLDGRIVALKGLGGFLFLVDAAREETVRELRRRKQREEKPLAVMVPDLATARRLCVVDEAAERLLRSPESPIVLLDRRSGNNADPADTVAEAVAPGNPRLGIMLPCTPLHFLVASDFGRPVVATSGNVSDEPIAIDNREALERLGGIADVFLAHDRPVERHVDDSVVQFVDGAPQPLRRARGYAPIPIRAGEPLPTILAVGGHLKNAVALSVGESVFLSQHVGDMETVQARAAFERVVVDFLVLYKAEPVCLACDLHPEYPSTRWAKEASSPERPEERGELEVLAGVPLVPVQHHHAHLAACLAEHRAAGTALGVAWDGTGYGTDGTVWGGEFLAGDASTFERLAALRPFRLAGGDAAIREPRRAALGLLWEMWGERVLDAHDLLPVADFSPGELGPLTAMLARGFRAPVTTSAGRLFDGIASLLGLGHRVAFEGQAAMLLEHVVECGESAAYPLPVIDWPRQSEPTIEEAPDQHPRWMLDWGPLLESVLEDSRRGIAAGMIAARFHNGLVEAIVDIARRSGEGRVALTGGCFQNRRLTEGAASRLREEGFDVLLHRLVPANDGGLSLGQVAVAAARLSEGVEVGRPSPRGSEPS